MKTRKRTAKHKQFRAITTIAICWICVAACAPLPSISTEVTYCCRPGAERIHSYRVEFEDMPEFLKPMLRDEASIVLASKGLSYTEGDADGVLKMTYIDTPLPAVQTDDDDGIDGPAAVVRFRAEVSVEMKNSVSGELVSSGSLSRIHNMTVGTYMHEIPARNSLRKAFESLLSAYPDPIMDEF